MEENQDDSSLCEEKTCKAFENTSNESSLKNIPLKQDNVVYKMKHHVNDVHLKIKPFNCNQCESSFGRNSALKHHVSAVHEKIKPFNCNLCSYKCSTTKNLKTHALAVHEKLKPSNAACGAISVACKLIWRNMSGQFMKNWNLSNLLNVKYLLQQSTI